MSPELWGHGFRRVEPRLRAVAGVVRRRHRRNRQLDRTRLRMRRLDRGCHGCSGNCRRVGRRGMLGCDRLRPSSRRSHGHRSRFADRRGTFCPRRFCDHGRSNVCDRRRSGRWRRHAGRQQRQRIDVALRIAGHARAEVHVWIGQVDDAARTDCAHHRRFSDECAARHSDRPEVDERGRVAERRLDRHRLPTRRNRSGERHHTLYGSEHRAAARRAEVDTSVLAGRVRVRVVEPEGAQHRSVDGPRPGLRIRDGERTRANDQDCKSPHCSSLLPILRTPRP